MSQPLKQSAISAAVKQSNRFLIHLNIIHLHVSSQSKHLGKIGGDSVREYLESKYRDAINAGNAEGIYLFALLDALGIVGDADTLEVLLANYEAIKDPLRDVLLHEIVLIIERCNLEYQLDEKMRLDLLHALHNDNYQIQLSAAKGLNSI